jgi:hypothetical protein
VPHYRQACQPILWRSRLVNVLAMVERREKTRNGSSLSGLCHLCRVALHRLLVRISSSKGRRPFRVVGTTNRLPCCLTTSGGSVAQPLFVASGALNGSDGKKTKAPSMLCIILGTGSDPSLWFSFVV